MTIELLFLAPTIAKLHGTKWHQFPFTLKRVNFGWSNCCQFAIFVERAVRQVFLKLFSRRAAIASLKLESWQLIGIARKLPLNLVNFE